MWQRLTNLISNLTTYHALSPDLKMRRMVNRVLRDRPHLDCEQWFDLYYKSCGVSYAIAEFAYRVLGDYSGLMVGRLLPGDRLEDDLQWTQVCWFDWQISLCDDFWQRFQVDLSDEVDEIPCSTLKDLLLFLEKRRQLSEATQFPQGAE